MNQRPFIYRDYLLPGGYNGATMALPCYFLGARWLSHYFDTPKVLPQLCLSNTLLLPSLALPWLILNSCCLFQRGASCHCQFGKFGASGQAYSLHNLTQQDFNSRTLGAAAAMKCTHYLLNADCLLPAENQPEQHRIRFKLTRFLRTSYRHCHVSYLSR